MIPEDVKEKFEFYRKWFRTLLAKEFFGLPNEYQKRFLTLIDTFRIDCNKIYEEHKKIKEKVIRVILLEVTGPEYEDIYQVKGKSDDFEDEFMISYPSTSHIPKKDDICFFTIYSTDGKNWFSSKEELVLGRITK